VDTADLVTGAATSAARSWCTRRRLRWRSTSWRRSGA